MSNEKGAPSAPHEDNSTGNGTYSNTAATVAPPYPAQLTHEMPHSIPTPISPSPFSQPPPSYQDALSYPVSSYQSSGMSFPIPKPDAGQMPPYSPLPPVTQQYPPAATPVTPPVVVAVSGVPVGNCPLCHVGSIMTEFDLCFLVCIILLAIFTFPFGLLFLCCIPCTMHKRCSNCRRVV